MVEKGVVQKRICPRCGVYFPSQGAKDKHKRALHPGRRGRPRAQEAHQMKEPEAEEMEAEEKDTAEGANEAEQQDEAREEEETSDSPVYRSVFDWF